MKHVATLRGLLSIVALGLPALAQGPFSPELLVPPAPGFGSYVGGVEIADVNSDGRPDVILSGAGAGSVFLARGQGLFSPPTSFALPGATATRTATGDFDSDGDVDLVVGNWLTPSPSFTLLLNDGAGAFTASATVSLSSGVSSIAVGDFDGDSKLDVVAGRASGAMELLVVRGNGAGGFLSPIATSIDDRAMDLAVGDVNGDGKLDVATARAGGGATILIGDGAGGFSAIFQYAHGATSDSVLLVDVDGDLDLDLIDDRANASQVEVRLNTGGGTFSAAVVLTGTQATDLIAPDLDGDGRPDVVGLDFYGALAVWRNLGGGAFAAARLFGAVGDARVTLASADLDGDGRMDVAVGDAQPSSVVLMWGDGAANLGHRRLSVPSRAFAPAVADLNADGREDLIVASANTANAFISLHQPDGSFVTSSLALAGTPLATALGDVNGDGKRDLATAASSVLELRLGNGSGGFGAPISTQLSNFPQRLLLADISGDLADDLLWSYFVFPTGPKLRAAMSNGSGGFAPFIDLTSYLGSIFTIYGLTSGDFNEDHRSDAVVATDNGCAIVMSSGASGYASVMVLPGVPINTAAVADLDADGHLDLVLALGPAPQLRVFFGNGHGAFPSSSTIVGAGAYAKSLEIGDFDADGDLDILELDVVGVVKFQAGDGLGGFSPLTSQFPSETYVANDSHLAGIAAIDVDLDGRLDLAMPDDRLPQVTFLMQRRAWEHPDTYCTAKTTSNGCVPRIAASGLPSATATSGFTIACNNAINNKAGLLFYSLRGRGTLPFQGGTLCVRLPLSRTPVRNSGGNPPPNDCSGVLAIDINAFAHGLGGGNPAPALAQAGSVVTAQWWGRDPGSPSGTLLSDAIEWLVGP
jgi:hypothetical protein